MFFKSVYATCPVCIITVGGGLIIAKKLGIDDLLVSIWIGGLNTAIAFWFSSMIKNKILKNPYFLSSIFYFLTLTYLWYSKQLFHPKNTLWGIDKIILGMTVGLFVFLFSVFLDKQIRLKNKGKTLFYYQKVIAPFVMLLGATLFFKFFIK